MAMFDLTNSKEQELRFWIYQLFYKDLFIKIYTSVSKD